MNLLWNQILPTVLASVVLTTGCTRDRGKPSAEALPEKVILTEQSADLRALIADGLAAGKKRIVIPQGRYRVEADRGGHLVFKDLADIEIIATHVELVCTSTVQALGFNQCRNVTLRGLTIDYDPLPFTQGTIIAMAPDKSWLEFEVAAGYPENSFEQRIQIYNPSTGNLRRGDGRWDQSIEAIGGHCYRVRKAAGYKYSEVNDAEQLGDVLVTNNMFPARAGGHAVTLTGCKNVRLEDVTLYGSPCFGFLERDCDSSTYLRCRIARRDPDDDPVSRAQPRMRSLNADAFHSKYALKGPAIISCAATYQGDDCVNINGKYYYVSASRGNQLRIASVDKPGIEAGVPLEFLPHSGPRPPDAVAVGIEPDPTPITEAEKALIRKLGLNEEIRAALLSGKAKFFTLTLDREIILPEGSAVCCPMRLGNGFVVKDCDFGHNRSRGILIKASKGEVTGNRIIGSRMAAVLISPEFWWMEAGISSDVTVRDNTISGCLQTPIQILAPGGNAQALPAGAHRNIFILKNRIKDCPWPLIRVASTSGLTIEGNILPGAPPPGQLPGRNGKPTEPILLENCDILKPAPKP